MRILMLLDNPFVSDVRVEKEAAALLGAGHEVTVMCMAEDPTLPTEDESVGVRVLRRFPAILRSPYRRGYAEAVAGCVSAVLAESYDALHCHDFHMLHIGVRAKERRNAPLVYDAHENLAGWPFYLDSRGLANRLKGRIVWGREVREERRNAPKADRVIAVSHALARDMAARFRTPTPPLVLRNIPEQHEVSGDREALRAAYGIPAGATVAVHSGSAYHTDRQIRALFRIVAGIDGLVLLMLGSWARHDEMRGIAAGMGLEGTKVFFGPFVRDPSERLQTMAGADLAVMHVRTGWPAHRMGFANKFLEYTFAGLPVVAGAQEECVALGEEYGHARFYEEDDDAALERGLREVAADPEACRSGIPRARAELGWEREVQGLIAMYEELL